MKKSTFGCVLHLEQNWVMGKKNIRIDIEYDYDFLLIGICSPLKEYQLCYHINKVFQIELQRSNEDIEMTYPEALEQGIYPLYEYWDTQYENQWYLHLVHK